MSRIASITTTKKYTNVWYYICMAGIALLAIFLRFYKLTELPYGIHIDEAALGVNSFSLANFGVDRYLNSYPIYPKNFDGGQSPFYSYLVAFFIKVFWNGNLDLLVVRLPMALLNILAFFAGIYLLGNLVDKKWQVLGAFIYAVLPYFVMQGRFGLDCNAMVSMMTISFLFLFLAFKKDKYLYYLLFGIFWGITYHTYALSYISNTLTLLLLSAYLLYTRKSSFKQLFVSWLSAFILAAPLVLMVLINTFNLPDLTIGKMSIFKLDNYRGSEIGLSLSLLWSNFKTVLKCILFKDGINYSSFDGFYTMYICSIPFLFIGCVYVGIRFLKSIKGKEFVGECIFLLVFIAQFLSGMLLSGDSVPQIHRLNGIFFAQFILVFYGIYILINGLARLLKKITKDKFPYITLILMCLVALIYLGSFLPFAKFYFNDYKDAIYPQMLYSDEYTEAIEYLEDVGLGKVTTFIDASIVYFQFSIQMNPYDLYNTPGANLACYKNFFFLIPNIEKGNVYIIRKEDAQRIADATDKGLELIFEDSIWRIYY